MSNENDFSANADEEGESPELYTVMARYIVWPEGVSLPTAAKVEVPGWLDGRSHLSVGRSDWYWCTMEALAAKFGEEPVSIWAVPEGATLGLHLIIAQSETGNLNLLVWAYDADEAVLFWSDYYELDNFDRPERIFLIPTDAPDSPQALAWHDDVQEEHSNY
jgi:hypothetical protein